MNMLLPQGLISLHEARSIFERVLFAGIPDRPVVARSKKQFDTDVGDGSAQKSAAEALWGAIDREQLHPWLIGGNPPKKMRLARPVANSIPMLRETGGLSFLRPKVAAYKTITSAFGADLVDVHLAFRSDEVRKAAKRALRFRRTAAKRSPLTSRGRRSSFVDVGPVIEQLIDSKQWDTSQSVKRLTQLVNRSRTIKIDISEDSVARFLARLHDENGNRKFLKPHRRIRGEKST
jgi:hypothetical protein